MASSLSANLAEEAGRFNYPRQAKLLSDRHEPTNALIKKAEDWRLNFMSLCHITSLFAVYIYIYIQARTHTK